MTAHCRRCHAPVMTARTTLGLTIAIDAWESRGWFTPARFPDGNLRPTGERADVGDGMTVIVVQHVHERTRGEQLLRRHRDSCAAPPERRWSTRPPRRARSSA
jgi:hypothetical protein